MPTMADLLIAAAKGVVAEYGGENPNPNPTEKLVMPCDYKEDGYDISLDWDGERIIGLTIRNHPGMASRDPLMAQLQFSLGGNRYSGMTMVSNLYYHEGSSQGKRLNNVSNFGEKGKYMIDLRYNIEEFRKRNWRKMNPLDYLFVKPRSSMQMSEKVFFVN